MQRDHKLWARDWAILGGLTSGIAPQAARAFLPDVVDHYSIVAACLGALSGAGVGLLLRAILQRAQPRTWVALCLVVAPLTLAAWGSAVATLAALVTIPELVYLAAPSGSVSAMVQIAWFAPIYAWVASREVPRLPVVLPVAALAAPVSGAAATAAVLLGLHLTGVV